MGQSLQEMENECVCFVCVCVCTCTEVGEGLVSVITSFLQGPFLRINKTPELLSHSPSHPRATFFYLPTTRV